MNTRISAIVLAGGAARRLGGADKPALSVGGRSLLDRVVAAAESAGVEDVIVVGLRRATAIPVRWVQEEPPGAGPAAALAAGMGALMSDPPDVVLVLASDLPYVASAVSPLLAAAGAAASAGRDGAMARCDGHDQFLLFAATPQAIIRATGGGAARDWPMRTIIEQLVLDRVEVAERPALDLDTWDAVAQARSDVGEATDSDRAIAEWLAEARVLAGVEGAPMDVDAVLDLARDAAHGIARPAAPLTAFILGYAAAARNLDAAGIADLASRIGRAATERDEP